MKRIALLMATIVTCLLSCSPALAATPEINQAPVVSNVTPKFFTVGNQKYRVTNATLNGQPTVRADLITKKAHAASSYLHAQNAGIFCRDWNNQSAVDNIRYVEAANSRPAYFLYTWNYNTIRYSNTRVDSFVQWMEWPDPSHYLAIEYGCSITGSDDGMWMLSVGGSAVHWADR